MIQSFILVFLLSAFPLFRQANGSPVENLWLTDYQVAVAKAKEEQKPLMMVFSGSDWCKPCIRLQKEVFSSPAFHEFAEVHLVLLEVDFPRNRKNRLPKELTKANNSLAEKYNPEGIFPLVVLVGSHGEVLGHSGFREGGAEAYIAHLKLLLKM